jgi:hypothetical protein
MRSFVDDRKTAFWGDYDSLPMGRGTYELLPDGRAIADRAIQDSGAISMWRPAVHRKPESVIQRVSRSVDRLMGKPVYPAKTSQQGSAAASPVTYPQTLPTQRFQKAQYIGDNYSQWYDDPACRKSCNMYCFEAVRGGVTIRVAEDSPDWRDAQDIADEYIKLWPVHGGPRDGISLMGGALCAMLAGEFWPQAAVAGNPLHGDGYIANFLNMPAVGMERNTDDADQFVDVKKAYSQVDTQTWGDIAYFPEWCMYGARWNWIPGSKNGNPEIISVRRMARLLELMEATKVTQVQVRSSLRYIYQYGTKENPATRDEVRDLMALNGFVEGKRQIFDPTEGARDVHMTGVGDVKAIEGDQHVGEIEHLKYFLDRVCNGYPTPRQIMSLGSENINRDVLKDVRAQWMADTVRVNQFLDGPIKFFYELSLICQGLNPDFIRFDTLWTKSTTETEQDRIDSIIAMRSATPPLVSQKRAVEMLQQYTQIPDVDTELKLLAEEADKAARHEVTLRTSGLTMKEKANDESPDAKPSPVRRTNGKADGFYAVMQ